MQKERYECHGHILMDGEDFKAARARHKDAVRQDLVRAELTALKEAGVAYFRDGGDAEGAGLFARSVAGEYGIQYVTPAFAIHKKGYYGGIVGRGFGTEEEYRQRIGEADGLACDFIKIMVSGIITFRGYGDLSCPGLPPEEIRQMIRIAHDAGFAIMIHVNGDAQIRASVEAGADSIEHGYFAERETLKMLADSESVWVPTLAAVDAFIGRDGFDADCAREICARQQEAIAFAAEHGAKIGCGSDSGAVGVPHGPGTVREEELLSEAGIPAERMREGSAEIIRRFRREK